MPKRRPACVLRLSGSDRLPINPSWAGYVAAYVEAPDREGPCMHDAVAMYVRHGAP